jgi:hypothetical protein
MLHLVLVRAWISRSHRFYASVSLLALGAKRLCSELGGLCANRMFLTRFRFGLGEENSILLAYENNMIGSEYRLNLPFYLLPSH